MLGSRRLRLSLDPWSNCPAADNPVADTPAVDTPAVDTPAVDNLAADNSVADNSVVAGTPEDLFPAGNSVPAAGNLDLAD